MLRPTSETNPKADPNTDASTGAAPASQLSQPELGPPPVLEDYDLLHSFPWIVQEQTSWCWTAVALSANQHRHATQPDWQGPTGLTQCQIAHAQFPDMDCCGSGAADESRCNVWGKLSIALETAGLAPRHIEENNAAPRIEECQEEISNGRPVIVRVREDDGSVHFIVIYGVGPNDHFAIWDPVGEWKQVHLQDWYSTFGESRHKYFLPK